MKNILFIPHYDQSFKSTLFPLIKYMKSKEYNCKVFLYHFPREKTVKILEGNNIDFIEANLSLPNFGYLGSIIKEVKVSKYAKKIINENQIDLLVTVMDGSLFEKHFVRNCNIKGIQSLLIQWAFSLPQKYYDYMMLGKLTNDNLNKLKLRVKNVILSTLGFKYSFANTYGGGEASKFAIMGRAFEKQFYAQGVKPGKIIVTGHPEHDNLYNNILNMNEETRKNVYSDFKLSENQKIVLLTTQPHSYFKVMKESIMRKNYDLVINEILKLGKEYFVIVKIHPRESINGYYYLQSKENVNVVKDYNLNELIYSSHLFISQWSSTILNAMAFKKPIISFNFDNLIAGKVFKKMGGTIYIDRREMFGQALRQTLFDKEKMYKLKKKQEIVTNDYMVLNGKVMERLFNLMKEMIR